MFKQKALKFTKRVIETIANFFRFFAPGKLQLSTYHKGKMTYGSVIGGIITLALIGVVIGVIYSIWHSWWWFYVTTTGYSTKYYSSYMQGYPELLDTKVYDFLMNNNLRIEVVSHDDKASYASCDQQVAAFTNMGSSSFKLSNAYHIYNQGKYFYCVYNVKGEYLQGMNKTIKLFTGAWPVSGGWQQFEPQSLDLRIVNNHTDKTTRNIQIVEVNIGYYSKQPGSDSLSDLKDIETLYSINTATRPKMIQMDYLVNTQYNKIHGSSDYGTTKRKLYLQKLEETVFDIQSYQDSNDFTLQFRSGKQLTDFYYSYQQADLLVPVTQMGTLFAFAYAVFALLGWLFKPLHQCCLRRDLKKIASKAVKVENGFDPNKPEPLLGQPIVVNDISSYYNQTRIDINDNSVAKVESSPKDLFSYQNLKELTEQVRQLQVTIKIYEEKFNNQNQLIPQTMPYPKQMEYL